MLSTFLLNRNNILFIAYDSSIQAEFENGNEEENNFQIQEIDFQNGADEDDAEALSSNYCFIKFKNYVVTYLKSIIIVLTVLLIAN